MMPTVYLTSVATVAAVRRRSASPETARFVGAGRVFGIMRRPPAWSSPLLDGAVIGLMPTREELATALAAGARDVLDAFGPYVARLRGRWNRRRRGARDPYAPGALRSAVPGAEGAPWDGELWTARDIVRDGDTLVCLCGRGRPCHRWVAAELLDNAGWQVVSDGGDDERRVMALWRGQK